MIAPHQVPRSQASAATRQAQPAPAAPAAAAQPAPAAPQPPHPTAGGPVAVLHDGAKLHFPPGTTPEGMDAGVQHHLSGRAQGAKEAQSGQQAMMLQILQALLTAVQNQNQMLQAVAQAIAATSGRTTGSINASTQAIVAAIREPKALTRDAKGKATGTAPISQPTAWTDQPQ